MYSLKDIFGYSPESPLLFTQYLFWVIFTAFLFGYALLHKTGMARRLFLAAFGVFFYYKSGGFFFTLLLFTTATDYFFGLAIHRAQRDGWRRFFAFCSISINLLLLFYFKYSGFLIENINLAFGTHFKVHNYLADIGNAFSGGGFDTETIFLPVGISFFTFQAISYAVDIYRRKIEPLRNILDYCFFVTYFPQLLAGPILRAVEFVPQIHKPYRLEKSDFGRAGFLILNGLVKKILISDYISGNFVDRVFENPHLYSGFENLLAAYGYTIQIYCDFSGYTDIAIGLSLLMGFHLPMNFNSPYKAINITDFWRRWHISLSSWLRDYLYIPLGGNRKGKLRQYLNLFLTMLLGGLWHGAHLRFVLWGGLHGLALAAHKLWMEVFPKKEHDPWSLRFLAGLLTFHFVVFCWLFFRAPSVEIVGRMLHQIAQNFKPELALEVLSGYKYVFAVMLFGYLVHFLPYRWKNEMRDFFTWMPLPAKAIAIALIVVGLYQVQSAGVQPFIYFQF